MRGWGKDRARGRGSATPIPTLFLISILMYPFIHPFTHSTKYLSWVQPCTGPWSHCDKEVTPVPVPRAHSSRWETGISPDGVIPE